MKIGFLVCFAMLILTCNIVRAQVPDKISLSEDNSISFDLAGFGVVSVRPTVVNMLDGKWKQAVLSNPIAPDSGQSLFSEADYGLIDGESLQYSLRAEIEPASLRIKSSWDGAGTASGFCFLYLALPADLVVDLSVFVDEKCVFSDMKISKAPIKNPRSVSIKQTSTGQELFAVEGGAMGFVSIYAPKDPALLQIRFSRFSPVQRVFSDATSQELVIRFTK